MSSCVKHSGIVASSSCGECGHAFCEDCLVEPFGPKKPPMCIACALAFAGVNQRAQRPRKKQKASWGRRRKRKTPPNSPVDTPVVALEEGRDFESFEIPAAS